MRKERLERFTETTEPSNLRTTAPDAGAVVPEVAVTATRAAAAIAVKRNRTFIRIQVSRLSARPPHLLAEVGRGETRQRQGADQQPEIAHGDVAVAAHQQEVDDDAAEPAGDQQATEAWRDEHDQPGDDLHDADEVHGVLGAPRDDAVEVAREVAGPVPREDLRELVEAEQDRRDGEDDSQQEERLRGRVAAQRVGAWNRDRPQGGGNGGAHWWLLLGSRGCFVALSGVGVTVLTCGRKNRPATRAHWGEEH